MDDGKDYVELVRQAQLGSRESVEVLSERVRGRLYAYVYRIVVDRDFAQDVVQESMLEMVKALGKLENAERFWPWLRTIAFNKIRRTHSARKGRRMPGISDEPEARGGGGQSTLLVSDYFGYDHWRSPRCVGSCEKFGGAGVTEGTSVSSAYWSGRASGGAAALDSLRMALYAGYADGHVGGYGPSEVVPMKVSLSSDGRVPYPDGVGPGVFYLPRERR